MKLGVYLFVWRCDAVLFFLHTLPLPGFSYLRHPPTACSLSMTPFHRQNQADWTWTSAVHACKALATLLLPFFFGNDHSGRMACQNTTLYYLKPLYCIIPLYCLQELTKLIPPLKGV